jgi:hypothetical protein
MVQKLKKAVLTITKTQTDKFGKEEVEKKQNLLSV